MDKQEFLDFCKWLEQNHKPTEYKFFYSKQQEDMFKEAIEEIWKKQN